MLQGEAREIPSKPKKSESSLIKTNPDKINGYSELIHGIVSELGFLIPDPKYENDTLRRKYQPSLKFNRISNIVYSFIDIIFLH